jgi:hypothetical protein
VAAKIFNSVPFRWSASLALAPALFGLPATSYAGMSVANMLWRVLFDRDSPTAVYVVVGLVYGLTFGVLLQCFLLGIIGHLAWQVSWRSLQSALVRTSRFVKTVLWIGAEIVVIPISFYITMMAYGGPAFLSWLFSDG